jgi:hypothetical protein
MLGSAHQVLQFLFNYVPAISRIGRATLPQHRHFIADRKRMARVMRHKNDA